MKIKQFEWKHFNVVVQIHNDINVFVSSITGETIRVDGYVTKDLKDTFEFIASTMPTERINNVINCYFAKTDFRSFSELEFELVDRMAFDGKSKPKYNIN